MEATYEEMKLEAIRRLETLGIYKPYIRKFASKATTPTFFEGFAGFYADQEPNLMARIREVENNHKYLVYALTHERIQGDEMWTMLIVSKYKDDWECEISPAGQNQFYVFSFVYNATTPEFSEAGDVVVKSFGGGIVRIA